MKKTIYGLVLSVLLASCGGSDVETPTTVDTTVVVKDSLVKDTLVKQDTVVVEDSAVKAEVKQN